MSEDVTPTLAIIAIETEHRFEVINAPEVGRVAPDPSDGSITLQPTEMSVRLEGGRVQAVTLSGPGSAEDRYGGYRSASCSLSWYSPYGEALLDPPPMWAPANLPDWAAAFLAAQGWEWVE